MGRALRYWLVLAPVATVVTYATALALFRTVDLSFVQFATLLCAPMAQAIVLAWRDQRPADALAALGWTIVRHPLTQAVIVLDGLVIGAGLVGWEWHLVGFGATVNIQATWMLIKATAAAVFFGAAVIHTAGPSRMSRAIHVVVPLLLVFALAPSTSWLARLFVPLHAWLGLQAEVVQRLAFYVPMFSMLIVCALRSARHVQRWSAEAGRLLQITVAASIGVAMAVVLATFNLPMLTQPWLGIATFGASVAATATLLASILLTAAKSPSTEAP
ncbi:MAG: hypothetical protein KA205_00630 [Acidobacteria bacterium]|nr:hypothetical protein [Acidobacteriota bacterium]